MRDNNPTIKVRSENKFILFVVVSIVCHLLVIKFYTPKVSSLSQHTPSAVAIPKTERTVIRLIEKKRMQIVDTSDQGVKREDDKSKFLGKEDMFFKKQTIARDIGKFQKGGGKGQQVDVKQLQVNPYNRQAISALAKMAAIQQANPSAERAVRSDHIEDIPLGDITQLNTSAYKFYGFLERFKNQMEGHWRLKVREFFDKNAYGRIPSSQTQFSTNLIISLDAQGQVVDIDVDSSSGVQEVDEIAISAIYKVGSFPNPPQEMVVNGRIAIPFGFVLN